MKKSDYIYKLELNRRELELLDKIVIKEISKLSNTSKVGEREYMHNLSRKIFKLLSK